MTARLTVSITGVLRAGRDGGTRCHHTCKKVYGDDNVERVVEVFDLLFRHRLLELLDTIQIKLDGFSYDSP